MKKAEREAFIIGRARELAASGTCKGWLIIEMKLRAEGHPEARRVLDNALLRKELDATCKGKSIYDA